MSWECSVCGGTHPESFHDTVAASAETTGGRGNAMKRKPAVRSARIVARPVRGKMSLAEARDAVIAKAVKAFPDYAWAVPDIDRAVVRLAEKHVARYPEPSHEAALLVRVVEEEFSRRFRDSLLILRALLGAGRGPVRVRWEIAERKAKKAPKKGGT